MGHPATITDGEREKPWRRYKAAETIVKIGREPGQRPTNIRRVLQASGGIAPAQPRPSSRVLSFGEREDISRAIAADYTFKLSMQRFAGIVIGSGSAAVVVSENAPGRVHVGALPYRRQQTSRATYLISQLEISMYIGGGLLGTLLIVALIVFLLRRS